MAEYIERFETIAEIQAAGKIGKQSCMDIIRRRPTSDVVEVVRCKDCVHRPEAHDGVTSGVGVEPPRDDEGWHDDTCPYLCGDPWYNEMPDDNWFCHLGERKGNG